jgi:hypothetical protein
MQSEINPFREQIALNKATYPRGWALKTTMYDLYYRIYSKKAQAIKSEQL